jgi:hypothetical protein
MIATSRVISSALTETAERRETQRTDLKEGAIVGKKDANRCGMIGTEV